jgi:tRNA pseudouridine55 synthase
MRRLLNTKKIGHSGTLDPMAEGVLPTFVGAATKAVDYCPDTLKEYRAAFKFGITTDTQDSTGTVLTDMSCFVPRSRLVAVMERYRGEIEQIPPMFSAVKVDGKRLYESARKGEVVERKPRKVTIHSLELEQYSEQHANNEGIFRVSCSKGTYIRTLIHDIGQELGFGAIMTALQRTNSNGFTLEHCYTLEQLREVHAVNPQKLEEYLIPLESLFGYPKAHLDEYQMQLFRNGVVLNADLVRFDCVYDGTYSLCDSSGRIVALGAIERDHSISILQRFSYA